MPDQPPYKRVLLKVSGEALMGRREFGLDTETMGRIAADVNDVVQAGVPSSQTPPQPPAHPA